MSGSALLALTPSGSALLRYVLECASCGVIYRSRQFWMGNQDPESGVVRSEVKHVWEGVCRFFLNYCFLNPDLHTDLLDLPFSPTPS